MTYDLQVSLFSNDLASVAQNQSWEQIKTTLTIKPLNFGMHVSPRKDKLISEGADQGTGTEARQPENLAETTAVKANGANIAIFYGKPGFDGRQSSAADQD